MSRSRILPTLCCLLAAFAGAAQVAAQAQAARKPDKAAAYYHFSVGHLYAELAQSNSNPGVYVNKAIENYRLAMKADPDAAFLSEELSDLYITAGRIREAVSDAEDALKANPSDVGARRILGRIYTRMIGDPQQGRIDEKMLPRAIEQYQKIAELQPDDVETWLMLGRLNKVAQNSVESEKAYKKVLDLDPNNEDALTGLAMVYSDVGDAKAAAEVLRRVVDKAPSVKALSALATTYEQIRDYNLAAEALRKALELSPGNPELKRAFAQDLLLAEQHDEALKVYKELAAEDPRDAQVWLRISQVYRQKRDFVHAREAAAKAREIEPTNLEVRYNEVGLLETEGKTAEATALLEEIVKSTERRTYSAGERSNRVVLLERLGLMYRANEQYEKAVETFRKITEADSDLGGRAAAQVIDTYRIGKMIDKAVAEADAAIQKYPEDRVLRAVRASVLAEVSRGDEAAAELKKLLDGKSDRETWISLAQIYEKSRKYDEEAKAIDEAEKLSSTPDEKEAVAFMRGALYEKLKKYDLAEAEFRKVLEFNPKSSSALNYLGYMLADRGVRLTEAQELISKALEYDPNNGAYLDSLGWVYYRQGKLDEAETYLRRALERFSKDPTVHDHLGDVYAKQGKLKEAIVHWEHSLREWDASSPSERDAQEIAKINKKLESARVRLAQQSKPIAQ